MSKLAQDFVILTMIMHTKVYLQTVMLYNPSTIHANVLKSLRCRQQLSANITTVRLKQMCI